MPTESLTTRALHAFENMCELEPHVTHQEWKAIKKTGAKRVKQVLADKDCTYLPDFKWMDFVAIAATLTRSIAQETQLRAAEATSLLNHLLSDSSESVRRLRLEAALERARYEPMMIQPKHTKKFGSERRATLYMRGEKMKQAQEANHPLPENYMEQANHAVERAVTAKDFRHYRIGPLLQLFAEILHATRAASLENMPPVKLRRTLGPQGKLWRSYILKAKRYSKDSPRLTTRKPSLRTTVH